MKVKAIKDGYDGIQYRHAGDIFVWNEKEIGEWMEKVEEKTIQLAGQQADEQKAGKPVSSDPRAAVKK